MLSNLSKSESESASFYLKLNYFVREVSKDSNSQNTSLIIKDKILKYSVKHGGCDPRSDIKVEYKIQDEVEEKIIEYIKKNMLNQTIQEKIPAASLGISVSLLLDIRIGNAITKSDISGAVNIWGARKTKVNRKSFLAFYKKYYHKIHSLLVFMKSELTFKQIEI